MPCKPKGGGLREEHAGRSPIADEFVQGGFGFRTPRLLVPRKGGMGKKGNSRKLHKVTHIK